uniref:PUA domain-containing protein n=1 Tax=Archaeoglobus fulgidus TaxID=2234 RepID=A0A7J2TKN0_ARCFL
MVRELRERERKVLKSALKFFKSLDFLNEKRIVVKGKEIFAVSEELYEFLKTGIDCIFGVKLGEIGKRLRLTLEGSYWLMRNEKRKVWVNDKGEMLFLYGRDIFAESVTEVGEFKQNEIVFVCNRFNDIIGIGRARYSSSEIKKQEKGKVVVENLVDRGAYLRHEKIYEAF